VATISAQYVRRFPPAPSPEPPLVQFIVLSMLLHVLVVLLFGTPQRGGVGSLGEWRDVPFAVTLRALLTMHEKSPFKPSHGADQGLAGSPLARRQSPATSGVTTTPAPRPEPPRVEAPSSATEAAPAELPSAEPTLESPSYDVPPVPGTLPRLDRGAPEVVDKAVIPDADVRPQEAPTETRPRVDLEAPRKVLPEAPPPLPAPARREPTAVTPPASAIPQKKEPVAIPKLEAPADMPVEAPPHIEREMPKVPPVVAPAAPPSETQPSTLPRIEQEATPKVESEKPALAEPPAKREAPAETLPRVEPEVAPKAERPVVPPAPVVSPREAPPAVAPPRENAPPPAIERTIVPAAPQAAPREIPAEAAPRSQPEARQKSEAASPRAAQPPALREAPAAAPVPRLRYGQPPDVDDIFAPRQPGETPAAGAPPPVDLDAARKTAREPGRITSGRTGIIPLNLFPPPPEPESKLGRAIQKAAQPDCREAYAAMGLLAIPFLLKDTVTDTGCRW
jgi:hypothetical protein